MGGRIAQPRGNFSQGLEDESPLPEARVRDRQTGFVDDLIAKQHQIEVERPRRPGKRALPSTLGFYREQRIQQVFRRQVGFADRGRVQERRLLPLDSFRGGFVGRRRANAPEERAQPPERERHMGLAVPEVRADRNGGKRHVI